MAKVELFKDFKLRPYQHNFWEAMWEKQIKRGIGVWHRKAGKDLAGINLTIAHACTRIGAYWHILPTYAQGRKIVWDGFWEDEHDEAHKFIECWPSALIENSNSQEMKLKLKNGAIWQVIGSDNYDSVVGPNPVGVIFSEYALQDPNAWLFLRPILANNNGWALFLTTPRGENHAHETYQIARHNPKDWYCELLTVDDTQAISLEAIDRERRDGMPEELIQQEFYCSFVSPMFGAVYGKAMKQLADAGRITEVPYYPELPVHTAWDLGMDDATAIWFFQMVGPEIHLIDYYEHSGEGLYHYAKHLQSKPYIYGTHIAPHDIEVRELGPGKSSKQQAYELGIRFITLPAGLLEDTIQATRPILARCWFDETNCGRGIKSLKSYHYPYDSKKKLWASQPLHDWSEHGASAFRYLANGLNMVGLGIGKMTQDQTKLLRELHRPRA